VLIDLESDGIRCVLVRTDAAHDVQPLSPREQEIARMIARGLPNKTIAAVLEISTWTVGTYLRRMFANLHVSSRAAMVAQLMQEPTRPR
jgi:DNA-binding NarL/FixJ family response regulator